MTEKPDLVVYDVYDSGYVSEVWGLTQPPENCLQSHLPNAGIPFMLRSIYSGGKGGDTHLVRTLIHAGYDVFMIVPIKEANRWYWKPKETPIVG